MITSVGVLRLTQHFFFNVIMKRVIRLTKCNVVF